MIGLVACGHSVGGVNGVDFPTIVTVPENETARHIYLLKSKFLVLAFVFQSGFYFDDFDTTDTVFDNRM